MDESYSIEVIQASQLDNLTSNIIELTDVGVIGLDSLCRICANRNDHLIPIYHGEGVQHQLEMKINRYFPFTCDKLDTMPTNCCYTCASAILNWHELIENSIEADKRLKSLQLHTVVQVNEKLDQSDDIIVPVENNELNNLKIENDDVNVEQRSNSVTFTSYLNAQKCVSQNIDPLKTDSQSTAAMKYLSDEHLESIENIPLSERCGKSIKRNFICGTCHRIFKYRAGFKHHLATSLHKSRRGRPFMSRFYCDICDYGYASFDEMASHRAAHVESSPQDTLAQAVSIIKTGLDELNKSNDDNQEHCIVCASVFAEKRDLRRHIKLRHPEMRGIRRKKSEITPEFYCDVCARGFTRKYDMQKHRKQMHASVPEKDNPKVTRSRQNAELLERCKIEYDGRTHYKCEHCNRVIHLSYNFIRHQTIHTGVRAYFCHLCGKTFRMSSGLNRHIKELHYGVKNYECNICGRFFASKNTRDDHMNIHSGVRPFVCDQCGKSFKQKASLHVHKIFHTNDRPFVCGTCGKRFRRSTELKVHEWLHTGHKPHVCSSCGSKFRLAQDLKRHQKTHNKDFQVSCKECGAFFGQERYLKSHLKTHRKKENLVKKEVVL